MIAATYDKSTNAQQGIAKTLAVIKRSQRMSSKVILLKETISINNEFRNLSGYEFSLQDFATNDYDESVRLYSLHFCEIDNLEEIWNKGNTLIALINGALNLYLKNADNRVNISADCITDPYLNKTLYSPSKIKCFKWIFPFNEIEFNKNILDSNFKPANHFLNIIIHLSTVNKDIFELLLLNSIDRNLTTLYKLYETAEYYFKKELNIKLGDGLNDYGIYKKQIRSFKQTANHGNYDIFQLLSYDVRHGRNENPENFNKMELIEATLLIQNILSVYIQLKYNII